MALHYPYTKVHESYSMLDTHTGWMLGACGEAESANEWEVAVMYLSDAIQYSIHALGDLTGGSAVSPYDWWMIVCFEYLHAYIDGDAYELTMDDILSAMVTATPYQLNYFIGLVDAYRQSIWNKPFNEEFFAALARGFE